MRRPLSSHCRHRLAFLASPTRSNGSYRFIENGSVRVSLETGTDPRLALARRWETPARWILYLAMAGIALSWLAQEFWVAIAAVTIAMPAAWLFNLHCPQCAWPAYRIYGTAKTKQAADQFLAPLHSKHLWKQPPACSKCGHLFRSSADMGNIAH